jgi:GNAT superfamily N-acetyltransferase
MSANSVVRPAHPTDYEEIWKLLRLLHTENGIFDLSEAKVDWLLKRVLFPQLIPQDDLGLRGYMGVIGKPGDLEGFILLIIGSYWYTDTLHLEELATFVHPNHRRSRHAQALLNYSKRMSDAINIPLLIGIISNQRTEAKVRLYRKHFTESGSFFLYNAKTGMKDKK